MKRVLVIDDEEQIRTLLRLGLGAKGWTVFEAGTGFEGVQETIGARPDLVLLDLGLPDAEGANILSEIRTFSTIPVIVISARANEENIVGLLEAGADDYVTKPFNINELTARMTTVLRRRDSIAGTIQLGDDIYADLSDHRVTKNKIEVHLTPTEYTILAMLIRAGGRIVTQNAILLELWGPHTNADSGNLRVHLASLRKKLEDEPARPKLLITEPGVGYRLLRRAEAE